MTNMSDQASRIWPEDKDDARARYSRFQSNDPFPRIEPALLISADIFDYVQRTAMVFPFTEENLKSASYSITIGDQIIYWDESGRYKSTSLKDSDKFCVPQNSILFIKTEEYFQLPDYLAMRFNLKIDLVHKGILLGTGPLVDPGFSGHLLVPLHNLTTNDYYFKRGGRFVWVEFTKISSNSKWSMARADKVRSGLYREFPSTKRTYPPKIISMMRTEVKFAALFHTC